MRTSQQTSRSRSASRGLDDASRQPSARSERLSDDSLFGFDDQDDFDRHDLLKVARSGSPYKAPVWIDVGDQDLLQPAAEKLADELEDSGADVTFHVWPGAHEGPYWDWHFKNYLEFYADACS